MTERIIIAGAGGQGIMVLGKVLAEAAMREGRQVTWFPSYGAEVRGGTAHCTVTISDSQIGSPCASKATAMIIMNQPSFSKFSSHLEKGGLIVVNSSLIDDKIDPRIKSTRAAFTDIAIKLGNIKVANMVALGALIAKSKIVSAESVEEVIEKMAPREELIEINKEALKEGSRLK